ncbi:hypothetical protein [Pseudoalteromonas xiamenensis]
MNEENKIVLNFGLFELNDTLATRDMNAADLELTVVLADDAIEALSQEPTEEESVSIHVEQFNVEAVNSAFAQTIEGDLDVQLLLNHGPVLSAVVEVPTGKLFVSPPMELLTA